MSLRSILTPWEEINGSQAQEVREQLPPITLIRALIDAVELPPQKMQYRGISDFMSLIYEPCFTSDTVLPVLNDEPHLRNGNVSLWRSINYEWDFPEGVRGKHNAGYYIPNAAKGGTITLKKICIWITISDSDFTEIYSTKVDPNSFTILDTETIFTSNFKEHFLLWHYDPFTGKFQKKSSDLPPTQYGVSEEMLLRAKEAIQKTSQNPREAITDSTFPDIAEIKEFVREILDSNVRELCFNWGSNNPTEVKFDFTKNALTLFFAETIRGRYGIDGIRYSIYPSRSSTFYNPLPFGTPLLAGEISRFTFLQMKRALHQGNFQKRGKFRK